MPTWRKRNAWYSFRKYTLELYDRPSAPLELKIRMLRVEVLETKRYGYVTWSPRACHNDTLRRAHLRFWLAALVGKSTIVPTIRFLIWTRISRRDLSRVWRRGGAGKIVDGVFPGRHQSFRDQRRPVDDCSPGRGGMAQNGVRTGGSLQRKPGLDTACSRMPERDGKDQGRDSPKQAGSCWFARPC